MSSGSDILSIKTPDPAAAAAEDEGEGDKGKFGDPKKLYKQNKDLAKTNAQLTKLIDTLKHEKDSLALDKSKLKGDLKSTEKELKKAQSSLTSAKSDLEKLKAKSQKHAGGANMGEGTEELQERVKQLEAELSARDEKLEKFRKRLGGRLSQLENSTGDEIPEQDKEETVLQEQERQKLMEENSELREKVTNLESDLNALLKLMDDQQREEFAQSTSTEISFFSTDAPSSSYSDTRHGNQGSSSPFSSPRNSPYLQRKNKTAEDIATLRSCLQLALEEKKAAEQQAKNLQTELDSVKAELEEAKRSWGQEKDILLRQLLKAHGERQRVAPTQDRETQHPLADIPSAMTSTPVTQQQQQQQKQQQQQQQPHQQQQQQQQQSETSPPQPKTRRRTSSSGSLTSSSELEKSSESTKSDTSKPGGGEKRERGRGRLKKQQSRENFTAALALFQSGETASSPKKERRPSESSLGSARSSTSPAPQTPNLSSSSQKLLVESRSQSVTVAGKPPIPPSSSGQHLRQSSADETGQRSPSKMSTGAKRVSGSVAQRRKSFEDQSQEPPPVTTPQHSRTASSPVVTKTLGSPGTLPKETETKETKRFDEEKARREQERRKQELEAEEKRKRELEAKRRREAEEKERERKEKEEKERIRREREERERERKQEELEKKRKLEERERIRKEREERERERKRELEEKAKHEREEREKKRQEELEKKRQLEQKRKEEEEEKKRQKIELERKQKEEQEAALRRQREEAEQKKRQAETAAMKKQREEEDKKKRQQEIERRLQLEEEKRNAEKAAQAATDPLPSKVNQHQSPFGSIAMRRAAFEQNTTPNSSPPVVLRRNKSPGQRPKSMDIGALMSTPPPSSPVASPTPRSPQISSISIKSSKSPQSSPVPQRKEVTLSRTSSIQKPSPPVTTVTPRTATVSITTTSSSPPLRRAQTLTLTPASLAVSTPDLSSVGTSSSNGSSSPDSTTWSPSAQHRTVSTGPKSPSTDRRLGKSVSFSPNLSTANRPPGILKPSPPSPVIHPPPPSSVNKMRFGPTQARLGIPADDLKKAQSLQNIPEHAVAEDTVPQPVTRFTPAAPTSRKPRPRTERAKTTSLSRADATNLVNLISKLQEKDKAPPLTNGVSNSPYQQTTTNTGFTPGGRPASMYGSITPSR